MKRAENIMSDGEDKYLLGWGMQILGGGVDRSLCGGGAATTGQGGGGSPSSPIVHNPAFQKTKT